MKFFSGIAGGGNRRVAEYTHAASELKRIDSWLFNILCLVAFAKNSGVCPHFFQWKTDVAPICEYTFITANPTCSVEDLLHE